MGDGTGERERGRWEGGEGEMGQQREKKRREGRREGREADGKGKWEGREGEKAEREMARVGRW